MVSLDCIVVIGDDRVRVAQIHLGYFQAPSICFVPSSVLALFGAVHIRSALHSVFDPYPCTLTLYVHCSWSIALCRYSMGRLSGCVLDSGHGVSSCVPIVDGYAVSNGVSRMNVGGHDVTSYFAQILTKCGDQRVANLTYEILRFTQNDRSGPLKFFG